MQHQEKYTLTWHSCSDHIREALREMITSSEFTDVNLVTDSVEYVQTFAISDDQRIVSTKKQMNPKHQQD